MTSSSKNILTSDSGAMMAPPAIRCNLALNPFNGYVSANDYELSMRSFGGNRTIDGAIPAAARSAAFPNDPVEQIRS